MIDVASTDYRKEAATACVAAHRPAAGDLRAVRRMPSPVGALTLVASGHALVAVLWDGEDGGRVGLGPLTETSAGEPLLAETERQLQRYFAGRLDRFSLPLAPRGTPLQRSVLAALLDIPFGETRGYGAIARALGRPAASRAVGAANGRNPISIIVPCHRLVGAGGGLTGFAGGLAAKRFLIDHEARAAGRSAPRDGEEAA